MQAALGELDPGLGEAPRSATPSPRPPPAPGRRRGRPARCAPPRPHRTSRPVNIRSAARAGADRARQQVAQPELARGEAVVDPRRAEVAAPEAIRRSQASARQSPPPIAAPLTAAITGWCSRRRVPHDVLEHLHRAQGVRRARQAVDVRRRAGGLLVGAGAEAGPGAGEHHCADRVVAAELRSRSRTGTITSKAIAFIRSGRFSVTTATPGSGRSTSTKLTASPPRAPLGRRQGRPGSQPGSRPGSRPARAPAGSPPCR